MIPFVGFVFSKRCYPGSDVAKKKTTEICVEDILNDFAEQPDPRSHVNQRHLLGDIIVISIMAVIAGADGPKAIGVWAKSNEDWLKDRLQLPSGVPSHDTIGSVLMTLKPAGFQSCFGRWIKRLSGKRRQGELDIVAIDGKALRRSLDRAGGLGPLFLVSAWDNWRRPKSRTKSPQSLNFWIKSRSRSLSSPSTQQDAKRTSRRKLSTAKATTFWHSKEISEHCMMP